MITFSRSGRRQWSFPVGGAEGFTLVEIMIVVAVLSLIAAMSIPNFLTARHSANESEAISSMRMISTACESFRAAQTPRSYPVNLAALSSALPPYLDSALAGGAKQGYSFVYALVNANQFTVMATPQTVNVTGTRVFFVDETGVIRDGGSGGPPIG